MRIASISAPFITIVALALGAAVDTGTARIRGVVGDVTLVRGGAVVQAKIGADLRDGDVVRAGDNTLLELDMGKGSLVTVRGPRTFRADLARLNARMESGGALYALYRHFSRRVSHRPPMTIVAAVRGPGAVAETRKVRRDFEEAVALFDGGKDDDAERSFQRLSASPYLTAVSREHLKYYFSEILFRRGKYTEALPSFEALASSLIEGFPYREDAHGKAMLCAEYAGRYDRVKELAGEYISRYGEGGVFSGAAKTLEEGPTEK